MKEGPASPSGAEVLGEAVASAGSGSSVLSRLALTPWRTVMKIQQSSKMLCDKFLFGERMVAISICVVFPALPNLKAHLLKN